MIAEPIESLEALFSEGPHEYNFDEIGVDEVMDCGADTLVHFWFICLVLSG